MPDLIVDRCRQIREELIRQLGGIDGLFRRLEAMDRRRNPAPRKGSQSRRHKSKRRKKK
jgi:hypothetical protein